MAMIFVNPTDIGERSIQINDKGDVHHLTRVLRLREGDVLEISDGEKWEYKAVVEYIDTGCIMCNILDKQAHAREPNTRVTLYQGFPKAAKMDTIIQKCVELGVDTIVPVYMDRSVVTDKGKGEKKLERWQKIADEASMQCRRGKRPEVLLPLKFKSVIEDLKSYDLILFPYENEEGRTIKVALKEFAGRFTGKIENARIAVVIGAEGGFSDKEAELLKEIGADCVSLGKTILRTETAGPATLAMIMYELEL